MSKKLKLIYACNDIPSKSFMIMIDPQTTCEDLLKIISERRNNNYITLFFENSQIDNCDLIQEFWETNPAGIFYATTGDDAPKSGFMEKVIDSKKNIGNKTKQPQLNPQNNIEIMKPPQTIINPKQEFHEDKAKTQVHGSDKESITKKLETANIITGKSITKPNVDDKITCKFYFTGGTKDHLLNGVSVDLHTSMNPKQCQEKLFEVLTKEKVDIKNKNLLIYLPGGFPFIHGQLSQIYSNKNYAFRKVIYGVLIETIHENKLKESFYELCNISDPDKKSLISPLCKSSEQGLSDMACLLGYLSHDGKNSDLLLRAFASAIHFAPLINSMSKIIKHDHVNGRDIVTFCSTLFTYFKVNMPFYCQDSNIYEYALRFCNLILHVIDIPEKLNIVVVDHKNEQAEQSFFILSGDPVVHFWKVDLGDDFIYADYDFSHSGNLLKNAYERFSSFTPIAPISMHFATGCYIVRGKTHEYLFLNQSAEKDIKSRNNVCIIDPMNGLTESIDVELFAKNQEYTTNDNLIDPDLVKQIIMVNLDESKAMIEDIDGYAIHRKSMKDHRITIAIQYLEEFVSKIYGYKIPSIQGLVSFNDNISIRCPLSPLVTEFENGLKKIQPNQTSRLWDSLERSCEEIVKFRKDTDGKERFQNAKSRILVISNGDDINSNITVENLLKKLLKNKIVVDCIVINTEDVCSMLCAVCHATGGLAFKFNDTKEGLSIIGQTAFLNIECRKNYNDPLITGDRKTIPSNLKLEQITEDFMNRAKDCAKFDTKIINNDIVQASSKVDLATPGHIIATNNDKSTPNSRLRRILKELRFAAALNDKNDICYDPDLEIYTFESDITKWKVFLKSPIESTYKNKWWYLYVTFPDLYPYQPPSIRFISVPYHFNVSNDGMICHYLLEKNYFPSKHVVRIIQEIKELFLIPNERTPIRIECPYIYNFYYECMNLAQQSAEENAKDRIVEYIGSCKIADDKPNESHYYALPFKWHVPTFMISQISGKEIQKKVLASSGIYYDRNELAQFLDSNKKPICVITQKDLSDKIEDLYFGGDDDFI